MADKPKNRPAVILRKFVHEALAILEDVGDKPDMFRVRDAIAVLRKAVNRHE